MKVLVVYESMFGNTRLVAEAVAEGLRTTADAAAVPVAEASDSLVAGVDLLVVGGPTHVHGMSRPRTRQMAAEMAEKPGSGVQMEGGALGAGLREWLAALPDGRARSAAFDTRLPMSPLFTGRASRGITRLMRRRGFKPVVAPESFIVDTTNRLLDGEIDRAREWGRSLGAACATPALIEAEKPART